MRGGKTDILFYIVMLEGECTDSPTAIAEAFNSYFAESVNHEKALELSTSIDLSVATTKRMIASLWTFYRLGPYPISSALVKQVRGDIALLWLNIFTLSLQSGQYPEPWKKSTVIPRQKSRLKTDIRNYRPTSHIAIVSGIAKEHLGSFLLSY